MILKKLSLAITIYVVTAWSEKESMDMRKTHKRGDEHFPKNDVGYRDWGDISIQDYDKPDGNQPIMPSGEI